MHVERKRRARLVGARVELFEIVGAEIVLPDRRRGIAGVARAGAIVFLEEFVGDLADLEVCAVFRVVLPLPITDFRAHAPALSSAVRATRPALFGPLPRTLWRSRPACRQNAVAEIQDVACAAGLFDGLAHRAAHAASSPSSIDGSTLPCSATRRPSLRRASAKIRAPVDAQHVRLRICAKLSRCCAEPWRKESARRPRRALRKSLCVAGSSNAAYSSGVNSARPGIEELHGSRAGCDLRFK